MADVRRGLGSDDPRRTDEEREEMVTGRRIAGEEGARGDDPADAVRQEAGADPALPRDDPKPDAGLEPLVISPPD